MDKKHLIQRGTTWYFNYKFPKHVQPYLTGKYRGKQVFQKSLSTDSYRQAVKARNQLLGEIKAMEAAIGSNPDGARLRSIIEEVREAYDSIVIKPNFENKEDEIHAEQVFNTIYDAEHEAKVNQDRIKAAAILIANSHTGSTEALGFSISITLNESLNDYLTEMDGQLGSTTLSRTKNAVNHFLSFQSSKDSKLADIKRANVVHFIKYLKSQNLSSSTVSNLVSCLNQVWKHARDRDVTESLHSSPFADHKIKPRTKLQSKKRSSFTPDQFGTLQSHLLKSPKVTFARKWLLPIAIVSGMRIEELCALRTSDIKLDKTSNRYYFDIHSQHRGLKTDSAIRKVPIHESVLSAVLQLKTISKNEFLFDEVTKQKPDNRSGTIGTWVSRLKNKHMPESKELTFHSLRHNFSTALDNSGVELGYIQTLMGHRRGSLAYDTYSSGKKFATLCSVIDSATDEFAPFFEHFPE